MSHAAPKEQEEEAEFVDASSDEQLTSERLKSIKNVVHQATIQSGVLSYLTGQVKTAGMRVKENELYTTLEDFQRADPEKKRVVLIGCTGAGKSSIANIAAGWKLIGKMDEDGGFDFSWKHPHNEPVLFEAQASGSSVTSHMSFANVSWLGDQVGSLS